MGLPAIVYETMIVGFEIAPRSHLPLQSWHFFFVLPLPFPPELLLLFVFVLLLVLLKLIEIAGAAADGDDSGWTFPLPPPSLAAKNRFRIPTLTPHSLRVSTV